MNMSQGNIPANEMRRILAAHGRTTTAPLGDSLKDWQNKTQNPSTQTEISPPVVSAEDEDSGSESQGNLDQSVTEVTEQNLKTESTTEDMSQPERAKVVKEKPSFYKRKFRVFSKEAWEYAMRDLGSIDTLLNHYGYVEPGNRGRTHEIELKE